MHATKRIIRVTWHVEPVTIVIELAVARESDQRTTADAEGIKDLRCCVSPDLSVL